MGKSTVRSGGCEYSRKYAPSVYTHNILWRVFNQRTPLSGVAPNPTTAQLFQAAGAPEPRFCDAAIMRIMCSMSKASLRTR